MINATWSLFVSLVYGLIAYVDSNLASELIVFFIALVVVPAGLHRSRTHD